MPIVGSFAGASARAYGASAGVLVGDFESIQTVTLSGNQLQIDFDNIPQTYTHLQLRCLIRNSESTTDSATTFRFNDDSGSNYAGHYIRGTGASVFAGNKSSATNGYFGWNFGATSGANTFGTIICDILDYRNTNKFKTTRSFDGYDNNGSAGECHFISGLWRSTTAITKISLTADNQAGRNFVQYSSFALYGVKA